MSIFTGLSGRIHVYMPIPEINQFDVLVHPDFHLRWVEKPVLSASHIRRRQRWDQRVVELKRNNQAVLLHFSSFLQLYGVSGVIDRGNNKIYKDELERIRRYKDQLGNRYLLFAGNERPLFETLQRILIIRGLSYDPQNSVLYAYGEYYPRCVEGWRKHLVKELGIADVNHHKLPDLSL